MMFNDDDKIDTSLGITGKKAAEIASGRTKLEIMNKVNVPLKAYNLDVLLELKGIGSPGDRPGVDIVAVIDVSSSMRHERRLDKLKTAMQFLIKKLTPIHRMSVVTFNHEAKRLCPLRQMTESAQTDILNLISGLKNSGLTNMAPALEMALQVLNERTFKEGRLSTIMLMSDGDQSAGDATKVNVSEVPVYTFGVGSDYKTDVLNTIAKNSGGGTFSTVDVDGTDSTSKMGAAFSQCLAGCLTVVVQDLNLIIEPQDTVTIKKVEAGKYKQTHLSDDGSLMVSFGDLYDKELRKILLELQLPEVAHKSGQNLLEISYSYRLPGSGKEFDVNPVLVDVTRTKRKGDEVPEAILLEKQRLETVQMMKIAADSATNNDIPDALKTLKEARDMLEGAGLNFDPNNKLIKMLIYEVDELAKLTNDDYQMKGRPFSDASQTSHAAQRATTRGDIEKLPMFATEMMKQFVEQFTSFDNNGTEPQTMAQDAKDAVAADPMAAVASLGKHLENAIRALETFEDSLLAVQQILHSAAARG